MCRNSANNSNKKQFSKRRKKKTPTVALPIDKYKEKRGIVQSSQLETNNGKNKITDLITFLAKFIPMLGTKKEAEVFIKDNFDLQKHLKETKKNYKHLTSSK